MRWHLTAARVCVPFHLSVGRSCVFSGEELCDLARRWDVKQKAANEQTKKQNEPVQKQEDGQQEAGEGEGAEKQTPPVTDGDQVSDAELPVGNADGGL